MIDEADENDKAFISQLVTTQMFYQYIEENCEIRGDDDWTQN